MIDAGVDVLLPVYWGAPSERNPASSYHYWSFSGLGPLVSARGEAVREGKPAPRIGLFYDTSTLQHNSWNRHIDLTTDYGREWFYESIRDFFSLIAPTHWAMINGQPLVFLYSASFAVKHDQSCIDFVRASLRATSAGGPNRAGNLLAGTGGECLCLGRRVGAEESRRGLARSRYNDSPCPAARHSSSPARAEISLSATG